MKYLIKGVQPVSFTNRETGELIEGVSLHCIYTNANVFGEAIDKIFVSINKPYYSILAPYVETSDRSKTPNDLIGLTVTIDRGRTGSILSFDIDFSPLELKKADESAVIPDISPKSVEKGEIKKGRLLNSLNSFTALLTV